MGVMETVFMIITFMMGICGWYYLWYLFIEYKWGAQKTRIIEQEYRDGHKTYQVQYRLFFRWRDVGSSGTLEEANWALLFHDGTMKERVVK